MKTTYTKKIFLRAIVPAFIQTFVQAFALLFAALSACMAMPVIQAIAAEDGIKPEAILCADDSGQYSYTYAAAEPGKRYALLVASGVYKSPAELDMDKIAGGLLYINQKTASGGKLSFDSIIPSRTENATVILASADAPPIIAGYISKDILKSGGYYPDASSQTLLSDMLTIKKNASWDDVKNRLPASCVLKINSDYAGVLYYPVNLTWSGNNAFDSTKGGKSFKITADAVLPADAAAAVRPFAQPFSMTVAVEDDLSLPERITAAKTKTVYRQGEEISGGDIFVKAVYSDGTVRDVTGWTTDIGKLPKEPGQHEFTVTYSESGITLTAKISILIQPAAQPDPDPGKPGTQPPAQKNTYQIVFETLGGSYVPDRFADEGSLLDIDAVPEPVKSGFAFTGWYADIDLQMPYDAELPVENDMILYAGWRDAYEHILKSLKITLSDYNFSQDDGLTEDMITVYAVYDDGTSRIVKDFTHNLPDIDQTTPGRKTLQVAYTEGGIKKEKKINFQIVESAQEFYTVEFNTLCGDVISAQNVVPGEHISEPEAALVREGYTFLGWDFDGYLWDFDADTVEEDMTLTAKWLKKYGDSDFYCYVDETREYVYTGKAVRPAITVMDQNMNLLRPNKDYAFKYADNVKASAQNAKVVIAGKGSYAGTLSVPFSILPKNIADEAAVSFKLNCYNPYKKPGYSPVPSIKYRGASLKYSRDFTVSYQKLDSPKSESGEPVSGTVIKDIGWYLVVVEGTGNYTGIRKLRFEIAQQDKRDIAKASLKFDKEKASLSYTGKAADISEAVSLSFGQAQLQEGTDYSIEYPADNISPGKKEAVAKALPDSALCYGEKTIKYEVAGLPMKQAIISLSEKNVSYTGAPVNDNISSVTMNLNGSQAQLLQQQDTSADSKYTLRENIDYTVSYKNNKDAGKATATLTGIGVFSGTAQIAFNIKKADLNDSKITVALEAASVRQDKSGALVPIKITHAEGEQQFTLQEGTDYTLKYAKNTSAGADAKVTITGIGNYKGKVAKTFTIAKKELTSADINISVIHPDSADADPQVFVYDNGALLKQNADYTVECKEGYVVIRGAENGSYTKERTLPYQVKPDSIADKKYSFEIKEQQYTGEPITFSPGGDDFTVTLKEGGEEKAADIVLGDDFEVVGYSKNTSCGTASVTIRGIGIYGGSRTVKFKIIQQKLSRS